MSIMNSQRGATLIEVMVSALILGFGLLGIEMLQARALQFNQQAYLYSQASVLANDIADRMRANPEAAHVYDGEDETVKANGSLSCTTSDCTPEQLARGDLAHWKYLLEKTLPKGDGSIERKSGQYVITAKFDDSRGQSPLQSLSITIQI